MSKLEVKVVGDQVQFYDPLNEWNKTSISFQRTLRLPDDGKVYPLPPSLGVFPISRVDDYLDKVPEEWKKTGGIFLPMYQREAMWLKFEQNGKAPKAIKVGVGKVNAVTGEAWNNSLSKQDYVVAGDNMQQWLDGINGGNGVIKQFVAMPLGGGYTVEAQVTGEEKFGGIQLMVFESKYRPQPQPRPFVQPKQIPQPQPWNPIPQIPPQPWNPHMPTPPPMLPNVPIVMPHNVPCTVMSCSMVAPQQMAPTVPNTMFGFAPQLQQQHAPQMEQMVSRMKKSESKISQAQAPMRHSVSHAIPESSFAMDSLDDFVNAERSMSRSEEAKEMGISAGGKMKQKIIQDPFGVNHWDTTCFGRCFVHIVNSAMYQQITGKAPPSTPISAKTYSSYGYKWYDMYEENVSSVQGSNILDNVKSVKEIDQEKYAFPQQDDSTVYINANQVQKIPNKNHVRDGDW
jgi:hypothetical protein